MPLAVPERRQHWQSSIKASADMEIPLPWIKPALAELRYRSRALMTKFQSRGLATSPWFTPAWVWI